MCASLRIAFQVAEKPTSEAATTLEEDKAHDAVNDFGENLVEDGFGNGDGGEFGEFMDLNLEDISKPPAEVSGRLQFCDCRCSSC